MRGQGSSSDYAAVPLQQPGSRGRAHTVYACKYRGGDGRPCHNKVDGRSGAQRHCCGHTCPAAGCTASKRSSASHCPDHAPAAGAKGKAGKKPRPASLYLGFEGDEAGSTAA